MQFPHLANSLAEIILPLKGTQIVHDAHIANTENRFHQPHSGTDEIKQSHILTPNPAKQTVGSTYKGA